jgi:hypothetical protein
LRFTDNTDRSARSRAARRQATPPFVLNTEKKEPKWSFAIKQGNSDSYRAQRSRFEPGLKEIEESSVKEEERASGGKDDQRGG